LARTPSKRRALDERQGQKRLALKVQQVECEVEEALTLGSAQALEGLEGWLARLLAELFTNKRRKLPLTRCDWIRSLLFHFHRGLCYGA
jgi:hypothetical protein